MASRGGLPFWRVKPTAKKALPTGERAVDAPSTPIAAAGTEYLVIGTLRRLPPELRLQIYEHVFGSQTPHFSTNMKGHFTETRRDNLTDLRGRRNLLALLYTCKVLGKEALSTFQALTTLVVERDAKTPLLGVSTAFKRALPFVRHLRLIDNASLDYSPLQTVDSRILEL
ncbi:hypothetical protein LTR85_009027 [Meristemomyces frigidus]|nr:hypothetical protein LTR85_009027 [Meristemomyces frigidus]